MTSPLLSETDTQKTQSIAFSHNRIMIDGKPRVLLCASLFPFRVPQSQWRQRLEAVKNIGYHAVDIYIPWNYHETAPGVWNFSGQKDIERFLEMTQEAGLYALVRPGPYICSEWDGGAIPAWVATDDGSDIRQNDPAFLNAVATWFDKIVPIIARQQYGQGGPVIMVQTDNELDFFECRDPHGYIGSLTDMLRQRGVTVPIISCAGQGDIQQAFGAAEGVDPAVNLYPDDNGVDVDEHVRYYRNASDEYDTPMVVTETNRWHRTLRRLVGNGARFIGPYLQVSGWDFDYSPSVNNWGSLEAYMTHDYDFGGVIDPAGQERPDADDARRLSAIIETLGARLAMAQLPDAAQASAVCASRGTQACEETVHEVYRAAAGANTPLDGSRKKMENGEETWTLAYDGAHQRSQDVAVGELSLGGGGQLLTLTNVSRDEQRIRIRSDVASQQPFTVVDAGACNAVPDIVLPAGSASMVVRDLPIDSELSITATNGEMIRMEIPEHAGNNSIHAEEAVQQNSLGVQEAQHMQNLQPTQDDTLLQDGKGAYERQGTQDGQGVQHVQDILLEFSAPTTAPGTVWIALDGPIAESLANGNVQYSGDISIQQGSDISFGSAGGSNVASNVEHTDGSSESATIIRGTHGQIVIEDTKAHRRYTIVISQPQSLHKAEHKPEQIEEELVTNVFTADSKPRWIERKLRKSSDAQHHEVAQSASMALEDCGIYSGTGRYRASVDMTHVQGLVLREASDTVNVEYGNIVTPWQANGGGDVYIPLQKRDADTNPTVQSERATSTDETFATETSTTESFATESFATETDFVEQSSAKQSVVDSTSVKQVSADLIQVTTRIWGHSNFDDSRLKSLKLNAKRGIQGALAVTSQLDLGSGWLVHDHRIDNSEVSGGTSSRNVPIIGSQPLPRGGMGGRTTTTWPHKLAYTHTLYCGSVSAALTIEGCQTRCDIELNGRPLGSITPLEPTLWIGELQDGDELTIIVWRTWGENAGHAKLLIGKAIENWNLESTGIPELREAEHQAEFQAGTLPIQLRGDQGTWVRVPERVLAQHVNSQNTVVRFDGSGVQITAFTDSYCLGRVVLGGLPGTIFAGGRGDMFLVPQGEGDLRLYVEPTRGTEIGHIDGIVLGGPIDR